MIERRNFYINGAWTPPRQASDMTVINPSTGEPCAVISAAGKEDVNATCMVGNDFSLDPGVGTCGKNGQWVPVGVGQPTIKVDSLNAGGERGSHG